MQERKPRVLYGLLIAFFSCAAAAAQPAQTIVMQMFDVVTSFAPPPWAGSANSVSDSETARNQAPTGQGRELFVWEAIPKGETFESWTRLYAISAEKGLTGTLDSYMGGVLQIYENNCAISHSRVSNTTPDGVRLFAIFCESDAQDPSRGEFAVFNMQMLNNTLVKNYYHIRVPAFSLTNQPDGPLSPSDLIAAISAVSGLSIAQNPGF